MDISSYLKAELAMAAHCYCCGEEGVQQKFAYVLQMEPSSSTHRVQVRFHYFSISCLRLNNLISLN